MTSSTIYIQFRNGVSPARVSFKVIFAVFIVAACSMVAVGQRGTIPIPSAADRNGSDEQHLSSIEEEMRAKREISNAEKSHKENVERARNLAYLTGSLCTTFKEKHQLDRDDLKKLEKAEKLARSIRGAAGGSDLEVEIEKRPTDLASALDRLSEVADSLKDRVEKTPKRVVSAAIIDEANVLLELIRIVRAMQSRA